MNWAYWREEIAKAADGAHQTIESIERDIAAGHLFVLTAEGCCYLVRLVAYPAETACQIEWAAGDLAAIKENLWRVEAWAGSRGCSEMLVEGRAGWARALRDLGYRPWSVTIRKALD